MNSNSELKPQAAYEHLNIRSHFSVLDDIPATSSLNQLAQASRRLGFTTLALTDSNFYGIGRLFTAAREHDLRPLPGITLPVDMNHATGAIMQATLLPQNTESLRKLFLLANQQTRDHHLLTPDDLDRTSKDTVILVRGRNPQLRDLLELPNTFYAVDNPAKEDQEIGIRFENRYGRTVVAHEVRMATVAEVPVMRFLQQVLPEGQNPLTPLNHTLKSPAEINGLYYPLRTIIGRSKEIAQSIQVEVPKPPALNAKIVPEAETAINFLRLLVEKNIQTKQNAATLRDRINTELSLIEQLNFANYILICYEVAQYCKEKEITYLVTGSGNNSAVLWLLGISSVDSSQLYFDRFINPERLDFPDVDFDLPYDRRGEVVRFIKKRYPDTSPLSVINRHKRDGVLQLARKNNITLDQQTIQAIITAEIPDHISTHPSGVIFYPDPPARAVSEKSIAQFDRDDTDGHIGIAKLDLLQRVSLARLDRTRSSLRQSGITTQIDYADPETLGQIFAGETLGISYLESPHLRSILRTVGRATDNHSLNLIGQIQAVARPDKDTRTRFYKSLHGVRSPLAEYPEITQLLKDSHYTVIYQEQVIRIATELAGLPRQVGDKLRKMMADKSRSEQQALLTQVCDALSSKYPTDIVTELVEQLQSFIGYGFVEGHSMALSQMCFEMAYYCKHYSEHFWAGILSTCSEKEEGLYPPQAYINEMLRRGITFELPPIDELTRMPSVREGQIQPGIMLLGNKKRAIDLYNKFLREYTNASIASRIKFQLTHFGLCFTDNPINMFDKEYHFDAAKGRQQIVGQKMGALHKHQEYYFLTLDSGQLINIVIPSAVLHKKREGNRNSNFLYVEILPDERGDGWQATEIDYVDF